MGPQVGLQVLESSLSCEWQYRQKHPVDILQRKEIPNSTFDTTIKTSLLKDISEEIKYFIQ